MASARSQVDFTTPEVFNTVMLSEDTLDSGMEINIALIKKNSILYRAGSVNARNESAVGLNSPLFMSDLESIAPYQNSGRTLMRGVTKKNLVLFVLEMDNIIKILTELEPMFRRKNSELFQQFVAGYLVKSDESLEMPDAIFPAQRPPREFSDKFYPNLPNFAYNNRIFAALICIAGYDGWISFPGSSLKQRNLDIAEFRKSGEVKFKYNPYAPEVVICKPNDNLIHGPVRGATASTDASAKGTRKSKRKRRTTGTKNKKRF